MSKCAYCKEKATIKEDAMGLPACSEHEHYVDEYYKEQYGHDPNEDTFLYCKEHCDLWQSGCARCEECCLYHYGMSVAEKFGDTKTPEERGARIIVIDAETGAEMKDE